LIVGALINPLQATIFVIALLTAIYFIDTLFSFFVLTKSLHFPPEISPSLEDLASLQDRNLPIYTILCPLYKEGKVLPHFVESVSALDWPKHKLDVQILLEEDDTETLAVAKKLNLPGHFRIIIVPDSNPRTKPKACNYGLAHAKGEYVVIYDAEDTPDPLQLKKSFFAFQNSADNVVCLQSKLNYYNPNHNLLTRLFTAEYSLWFDIILPGLQSIDTHIPLGGTSNHFKTSILKKLHAWDSFNVTEDCDLGVRLYQEGYKTAIVDSVTLEEANSNAKNWIRQRSRWIKGYLQTYLVHMRDPISFVKNHGIHALIFQLVIGMRMVFMVINPILWTMTILYFAAYQIFGPTIESLYPSFVFYFAVFSLIFGNFMYIYIYMIGAAKRGHWGVIKYVLLIPFYWVMASLAAVMAIYQLITKPHYWEKTNHGLHLSKDGSPREGKQIRRLAADGLAGGGVLVAAGGAASFLNLLYNAYLGRVLQDSDFGSISLIGNLFAVSAVATGAIGRTVTYKSAYLFGKINTPVKSQA
jgi:cellulose synthase/poly-beta-1,6-N-acetylglucosamine synthase-like glycosyltransferase